MLKSTPGPWIVDEGCCDDPKNMAICLLETQGTDGAWIAVGVADEDGYAASVAYCHPNNAPLIAAAPRLRDALCKIRAQTLREHGYDADCMVDEIMKIAEAALTDL